MKASFALLLVAVAGCLAASALAAGERADKSCGKVIGAGWVIPKTGGNLSGNKYAVTVHGVSCAIAKRYATKFSRSRAKLKGPPVNGSYPFAGGPAGYTCGAFPDANGKLLVGQCQVGPLTKVSKHVFVWSGHP